MNVRMGNGRATCLLFTVAQKQAALSGATVKAAKPGTAGIFGPGQWKSIWMTRLEMTQAIPPAYSEYLGRQVLTILKAQRSVNNL